MALDHLRLRLPRGVMPKAYRTPVGDKYSRRPRPGDAGIATLKIRDPKRSGFSARSVGANRARRAVIETVAAAAALRDRVRPSAVPSPKTYARREHALCRAAEQLGLVVGRVAGGQELQGIPQDGVAQVTPSGGKLLSNTLRSGPNAAMQVSIQGL